MKILFLSLDPSIAKEGSRSLERVLKYLRLSKRAVFLVSSEEKRHFKPLGNVEIVSVTGRLKILKVFKIYFQANKILSSEKFDLLSVQDTYFLALIGWLLAKRNKIGLELQVHGFEKFSGLRKLFARFVLPKASSVRVVSERLRKILIFDFKVDPEKITTVPVFTPWRDFKNKVSGFGISKGAGFVFLTVSRLVPVKRVELQILALKELVKKDREVILWIVGDGRGERKLKRLVKNLGLKDRVIFWGRKENVFDFYHQADAFLLTSKSEGWPISIIEAGSFSLPVIMTDVGSAGELVVDGESGLVVSDDVGDIASAMEKIINEKDLREKFGQRLRGNLEGLLSEEEILKRMNESWRMASDNPL